MKPHYESHSIENVIQFFADQFKDDRLTKNIDGSVKAEWWFDPVKGEVLFRLWLEQEGK